MSNEHPVLKKLFFIRFNVADGTELGTVGIFTIDIGAANDDFHDAQSVGLFLIFPGECTMIEIAEVDELASARGL